MSSYNGYQGRLPPTAVPATHIPSLDATGGTGFSCIFQEVFGHQQIHSHNFRNCKLPTASWSVWGGRQVCGEPNPGLPAPSTAARRQAAHADPALSFCHVWSPGPVPSPDPVQPNSPGSLLTSLKDKST